MGPRLRIVSDARESATHLDRGRQLALLIKDSADRGSIGFGDEEHGGKMQDAPEPGKTRY